MRLGTILLSVLLVFATVTVVAANEKDKPDTPAVEFSRGLLDCTNAVPVQCGSVVQGTNAGLVSNVLSYSCVAWSEAGGEVVYVITLPAPNNWTLTAALTGVTNDPDVFILGACDEAQCLAYGDATATASNKPAGTYYIVVDQYGSTTPVNPATWTLTVSCLEIVPPCCPFPQNCYFLDFNESPNGWYSMPCGIGPVPWAWGPASGGVVAIPSVACDGVPRTNVLVTNLAAPYPVSKGEAAVVGPFDLFSGCKCLEICHYYDCESGYDGGNVKISTDGGVTWTLITPSGGYPGINTSTSYKNECTWNERMFTGTSTTFIRSCFDIQPYIGQTVLVGFFFGSDSYNSSSDRGWAIKWLKIGGTDISPVEGASWGAIKALYR